LLLFFCADQQLECSPDIGINGLVSGDICGLNLKPDYVNLTCSINFRGNIHPVLAWGQGNSQTLPESKTSVVTNSKVSSSMIVQATPQLNGSSFICTVSQDFAANADLPTLPVAMLPPSWTSPPIQLISMILCLQYSPFRMFIILLYRHILIYNKIPCSPARLYHKGHYNTFYSVAHGCAMDVLYFTFKFHKQDKIMCSFTTFQFFKICAK